MAGHARHDGVGRWARQVLRFERSVPLLRLGTVGGTSLALSAGTTRIVIPLTALAEAFHGGFERALFRGR